MPPPRARARQSLVEQAVQRDRDHKRLVARLTRPQPQANPRPVVMAESLGVARTEWRSFRPQPRIDDGWYTPFSAFTSSNQWITTTASTTYITTDWYSTGSTLVYNQPWTWTGNSTGSPLGYTYSVRPPQLTPEEQVRRREHRARIRAEGEAANVVAYELLDGLLSREQAEELRTTGGFTVAAPSGNRYKLIRGRHAGNVHMWHPEQRRWSGRLCVHVDERYPDGDNLATQMLCIQTDEPRFVGTANIQDGTVPPAILELREAFLTGRPIVPMENGGVAIDLVGNEIRVQAVDGATDEDAQHVLGMVQDIGRMIGEQTADILRTARNLAETAA